MLSNITNKKLKIIAGPCSLNYEHLEEIYKISGIKIVNKKGIESRAVFGTRVVGLKSRTELNEKGIGMGIDYFVYQKNLKLYFEGKSANQFEMLPSIKIAKEIISKTNMVVTTEIMSPILQLPLYEKLIKKGKLMIWNPSVNQLGWPIYEMSLIAARNNWTIGIKNGKWFSEHFDFLKQKTSNKLSSMEKTWLGISKYIKNNEFIFIMRGVDIENKGEFRNVPIHDAAKRVKKITKAKLFFDPSHSFGSKQRNNIVEGTIKAMKIKLDKNNYLYDGILIEVGTSETDQDQHITTNELSYLCQKLSFFRDLQPPSNND